MYKIIFNSNYLKEPILNKNGFSQEKIHNLIEDGYDLIIIDDSKNTIKIPYIYKNGDYIEILYKKYLLE